MLSFLFLNTSVFAQLTFQETIGGFATDVGKSIVRTTDGGYAITGSTYSYGIDSSDVYVVKLNSSGAVQWTKTVGGPSYDAGSCIIQTSDGGYAITGRTGYWTFEIYVVKLDGSGNLQWTKKISNGLFDQGYSIIQTLDGGYAIGARSGTYVGWLVKLNSSGNLQWIREASGFEDGAYSVIQTADHGYVLSGFTTQFGAGGTDFYVIKIDSVGNSLWTRTVGGTGSETVFPGSKLVQTADGGFALTGFTDSFGSGGNDVYIVKLNSSGALEWTRTVGGPGDEYGAGIIQSFDQGYAITGYTNSYSGNNDAYIIKLSSAGNLQWTRTAGGSGEESGYSIVQSSDSGYVITGSVAPSGSSFGDVYLVKLNSSGYLCGTLPATGGAANTGGVSGSGGGGAVLTTGNISTGGSEDSGGSLATICSCSVPTAVMSGNSSICQGQSTNITISISGAPGPYAYSYSANGQNFGPFNSLTSPITITVSPNVSTTYLVTSVNAGGCSGIVSGSATITVNSLPSATITPSGSTTFCSGESVELSVPYGANKTYQWKKGGANISGATLSDYTVTVGGNYKVTVTNTVTGCSKTSTNPTVVTVNPLPNATITPQGPTTFCAGGSVILKANAGTGFIYQWKKGGNNIAGATNMNYTASLGGIYKVRVTNSNGCSKMSSGVTVTVPCREDKIIPENTFEIKVFPNPSSGDFILEFSNPGLEKISIQIFDVIGKMILPAETTGHQFILRNEELNPGIYSAVITDGENKKVLRLVKTNQ